MNSTSTRTMVAPSPRNRRQRQRINDDDNHPHSTIIYSSSNESSSTTTVNQQQSYHRCNNGTRRQQQQQQVRMSSVSLRSILILVLIIITCSTSLLLLHPFSSYGSVVKVHAFPIIRTSTTHQLLQPPPPPASSSSSNRRFAKHHPSTRRMIWNLPPLTPLYSSTVPSPSPSSSSKNNNNKKEEEEEDRAYQRTKRIIYNTSEEAQRRITRRNENNPNHPSYKPPPPRRPNNNSHHHQRQRQRRRPLPTTTTNGTEERTQRANRVETLLTVAIKRMHRLMDLPTTITTTTTEMESSSSSIIEEGMLPTFPSVRECNAALATIGDSGDFKRALRLFGSMRKAASLVVLYRSRREEYEQQQQTLTTETTTTTDRRTSPYYHINSQPPSPTLVTYSTLMSRAVALGKELVALRLWRLMTLQTEFYTNFLEDDEGGGGVGLLNGGGMGAPIVPDIKAVNILMNAFAKLADTRSAGLLMKQLREGGDGVGMVVEEEDGNGTGGSVFFDDERDTVVVSIEKNDDDNGGGGSGGLDNDDLIRVVPQMEANIVTFNTYIDACHRAGDLDAALEALQFLKSKTPLNPDLRTYTSLISTVARRTTRSSGARDPDLAFSLLDEMIHTMRITPNGMTYCALIDVCGRCHRVDLALKGLRMMLRQKQATARGGSAAGLYNEVGAWTSAIKACGRAGRLDTAIRLFHTMQKFGAKPNTVTCGCLIDCLLKATNGETNEGGGSSGGDNGGGGGFVELYVGETVKVMRYMKKEGLEPSEVMYTSLMGAATRLAKVENKRVGRLVLLDFGDGGGLGEFDGGGDIEVVDGSEDELGHQSSMGEKDIADADAFVGEYEEPTKALEIYTELILSLVSPTGMASPTTAAFDGFGSSSTSTTATPPQQSTTSTTTTTTTTTPSEEANAFLLKVFLVFQEMKASGSDPDLACYNALLQACARAGDTTRSMDVMGRIQGDGFHPNNNSWREMLRCAAKARRSDIAEEIWAMALGYHRKGNSGGGEGVEMMESSGGGGRDRYPQRGEARWIPNIDAFEALISAYIRHASVVKDREAKMTLLVKVIQAYVEVVQGRDDDVRGLNHVALDLLRNNPRVTSMILKATTSVEKSIGAVHDDERGNSSSTVGSDISCPFSQDELRTIVTEVSVDYRAPTR